MSDGLTISMSGFSQILDTLQNVSVVLQRQIAQTLVDAANTAVEIAQGLCPVETGYLQSTIGVGAISGSTVEIEATADYALFVECGHHTRSGSFVEPQPFLQPVDRKSVV